MAVDGETRGVGDEALGPDAVAEAPARHRIGLAPAVEQDETVADRGIGQQADMLGAVIDHAAIDLVAHDGDVGETLEPGDEAVDLGARHDAAGRVGRAGEDDEAGPRGALRQHHPRPGWRTPAPLPPAPRTRAAREEAGALRTRET